MIRRLGSAYPRATPSLPNSLVSMPSKCPTPFEKSRLWALDHPHGLCQASMEMTL
jgi:hypothetical protein